MGMSTTHTKDKVYARQHSAAVQPYVTQNELQRLRKVNDIGYGIKTPNTASEMYVDHKCPFTGNVNVRGRFFTGQVIKMKAEKTIVVAMKYLYFDQKYKRYSRRNTKINVHLSPCWNGLVKVGDTVKCGETRPLSKTKASVVVAVVKKAESSQVFKI